MIEVAVELERQALADDYFVSRCGLCFPSSFIVSKLVISFDLVDDQEAVPERRLLQRLDLQGHGIPHRHVPRAVHNSSRWYVRTLDSSQAVT